MRGAPNKRVLSLSSRDVIELAGQVLARGGRLPLRVTGASMRPWLAHGDLVVLGPVDARRLACGDVVLVGGARPLLHRVVRIDRAAGRVITRGDATLAPDAPVELSAVVGRVIGVQRSLPVRLRRFLAAGRRLLAWLR